MHTVLENSTHTICYTINNLVDFHPGDRSLTNKITEKSVTLQTPACFILLYLIENEGAVIPQNQLVEVGWGEKNTITSMNTLYQTVLTLRNALAEVGLSRDLIKTIARRGIMISANVQCIDVSPAEGVGNVDRELHAESPPDRKCSFFKLTFITGTLLVSTLLASVGVSVAVFTPAESLFSAYTLLDATSISSCTVLLHGKRALDTRYVQFMGRNKDICHHHSFVFISGMSKAKNIGAIVCQTDIRLDPAAQCTTWYSIHNEN
ncbi:winged helix-turn-helix domain-containing protein [Citrobacter sedlakii]|uniref:winged helix-turn-helix domain-containing protein n=1 Tax=Citrobacter sedlakii TaxID=67826 RepID=UPI00333662D6